MWKGEVRSIADIADMENLKYTTLWGRLNRGMTIEGAVNKPEKNWGHRESTITYEGQTLTLTEWHTRTGISRYVLLQRRKSGWPTDLLLTTPSHSKLFGWEQNIEHEEAVERELDLKLNERSKAA